MPSILKMLSHIPKADIRQRITRARAWNLTELTPDQVYHRTARLLNGYSTKLIEMQGNGVFRARVNSDSQLFKNVSELWYPPARLVRGRGRFNEAHQPKFYCVNRPHAAIFEVRPSPGDMVTVLVAGTKEAEQSMAFIHIGVHALREQPHITGAMAFGLRGHEPFLKQLDRFGVREKWLMLDDYLASIATFLPAAADEANFYKSTCAAERFLSRIPESSGLLYPSVAAQRHAINLCIDPRAADTLLSPWEAWVVRVGAQPLLPPDIAPGEEWLQAIIERRSTDIKEDGTIVWSEPLRGVPFSEISNGIGRAGEARRARQGAKTD